MWDATMLNRITIAGTIIIKQLKHPFIPVWDRGLNFTIFTNATSNSNYNERISTGKME